MPRASHSRRPAAEIKERIVRVVLEWADLDNRASDFDPELQDDPTLAARFDAVMEEREQRLRLLHDLIFDLREAEGR